MVTISDVAKKAGVSPTTVARVLHKSGYVSIDVRKKVEQAIVDLGYVPNQLARGLRKKSSSIIGHVIPASYINPFFALIGSSIRDVTDKNNYRIITVNTESQELRGEDLIDDLLGRMVAAIIVTGEIASDKKLVEKIIRLKIPVVMIERPVYGINVDRIIFDNQKASYDAVEHIIKKGHRRIGYICSACDSQVEIEKYQGYCEALSDYEIPIESNLAVHTKQYSVECGYMATSELMGNNPDISAIYLGSDVLVCGALQYLYQNRLRIPDDISLVGFDNTLSNLLSPRITSVAFPVETIGKEAFQMIMERLLGKRQKSKNIKLKMSLIDRNSVKDITGSVSKS